jgi:hypothetical protein
MAAMSDKKSDREKRLAKALRENLKRRKAQARAVKKPVVPAKAGTSEQEGGGDSSR